MLSARPIINCNSTIKNDSTYPNRFILFKVARRASGYNRILLFIHEPKQRGTLLNRLARLDEYLGDVA